MTYTVKTLPLADLHPDPDNVRIHNRRNIDTIKHSLEQFGQYRKMIIRKSDKLIVIGNGMYQAMKELGWTEAECRIADLTEEQTRMMSILDNRAGDTSVFKNSLAEMLKDFDPALRELCGFTEEEVAGLLAGINETMTRSGYIPASAADECQTVKFVMGKFSFEVSREAYDAWISGIARETMEDFILDILGVPADENC
jgi:ParB-like chromosome segregation protein Spo0J